MRIFCGLPSSRRAQYDIEHRKTIQGIEGAKDVEIVATNYAVCSLLAHGFNKTWCSMLNTRKDHNWTHYVMLHADIVPQGEGWFNTLVGEMNRFNLEAMSASVALRGDLKEVSTAVQTKKDDGTWDVTRLKIEETEGISLTSREKSGLLINTGCLIVRADRPWCESFWWHIDDAIVKRADGQFEAINAPEDWNMSRFFMANNIPYGCTGKVKVKHYGECGYCNWL